MSVDLEVAVNKSTDKWARIALVAMLMLAGVGIGIAAELTDVYYKTHTDASYVSACAISEGANCQTVATSEYSVLAGSPVSVWAIGGYVFFAILVIIAMFQLGSGYGLGLIAMMGIVFIGVSVWLVVLMSFIIHSICILCVAIDFINIFLFILSLLAIRSSGRKFMQTIKNDLVSTFTKPLRLGGLALAGLGVLAAAYFAGSYLIGRVEAMSAPPLELSECRESGKSFAKGNSIQLGVDDSGSPWMGAADPVIEIHEFTDYQCPFCRKAHRTIRQTLSKYPDKVRVYHRHYPLDQACNPIVTRPFHKKACEMSRMAVCAQRQGRFWEMNDFLFENSIAIAKGDLSIEDIATRLELDAEAFSCCMSDATVDKKILSDIDEGRGHDITGTPSFVVGDMLYVGEIPHRVFHKLEPGAAHKENNVPKDHK